MPTVVLAATDAAGNDMLAVTVTVDGAPFAKTLDGPALSIDPGSHTLRFIAAGRAPVEKTIVAREGEKARRVSVVIGGPASAPVVAPAVVPVTPAVVPVTPAASQPAPAPEAPPAPATPSSWSTNKTLAVASGGVGVVGIVLGSVFGAKALSDASTSKSDCSTTSCPNHAGAQSAHDSSESAGKVSTAMFIVGAAGLAGGAVLWFTAPKAAEKPTTSLRFDPMVGPQGGGLMLSGRFQ
jgi:hypothetical protein